MALKAKQDLRNQKLRYNVRLSGSKKLFLDAIASPSSLTDTDTDRGNTPVSGSVRE